MIKFILLFLYSAFCLSGAASAQPSNQLEVTVPHRPAVYRSAGETALRYEIHLKNPHNVTVTLTAIEIADSKRGTVLKRYAGGDLTPLVQQLDQNRPNRSNPSLDIVGSERTVVYIDIIIPDRRVPESLSHKLTYSLAGSAVTSTVRARATVDKISALVLGPPLKGGPWVAVHHSGWQRGHRRMFYMQDGKARLPGRFAIDWVGVAATGKVTKGNPDSPKDALGYGADVIAVADATVFAIRDDMAEIDSIDGNGKHSAQDAAGNHVVLNIGGGRYAFYEHLKPGSIVVRPGQRVKRGQLIGALGFTGDSTGPHLHFHVSDGPTPLGAEGMPFVIDRFHQRGRYVDIAMLGKDVWVADERWIERERPNENVVLEFDTRTTAPSAKSDK